MNNMIMLWSLLLLPHWWQELILFAVEFSRHKVKNEQNRDIKPLCQSVASAICKFDRQYIDNALRTIELDSLTKRARADAFNIMGTALYDLGYRKEGLDYMQKAVAMNYGSSAIHIHLCCRMNDIELSKKRLEYCVSYQNLYPEDKVISDGSLARAHMSCKQFELAEPLIQNVTKIDNRYKFLLAEYYYAKGDYPSAAKYFIAFPFYGTQHFWHAQYDYKKAVAYYRTDQKKKWTEQAMRMGRRLAWDKFYMLDFLEDEGIERIPEIDQAVEKSRQKKRILYVDKIALCQQRLPWLIWKTYTLYPYEALFLIAGLVFVGMLIYAFVKYGLT